MMGSSVRVVEWAGKKGEWGYGAWREKRFGVNSNPFKTGGKMILFGFWGFYKVVRPIRNNSNRVNNKKIANTFTQPHPKRGFVLQAVLTRSTKINTAAASVNTAVRPVNDAGLQSTVNHSRPISQVIPRRHSQQTRPFNKLSSNKRSIFNKKVNTIRENDSTVREISVVSGNMGREGNPQQKEYKEKGVIDSGCSRHITGNKCYLTNFEAFDGGFVSFGDEKGRIYGKGKIKTEKLDFDDVYFCKELKYKLFSVLQMYDKKNDVLFTDTECLILSFNFKLLDESQVLLRDPRKDNIYSVELKSVVPTGGIENQLDCKVKVIRSDNGTEFKNSAMTQFCDDKGIKREYSIARTPQQNKVAERRNMTLIEAARTMALVTKPHNKTPCELIRGRPPLIDFMKPFGCPVTILNTRDNLGKFEGKADEGYFVGFSVVSKAMRVFNKRTMIVEETLNIRFQENVSNVKGNGPDWLFDIDSLTISMNYVPVVTGNQTNGLAGTKEQLVAGQDEKKKELEQEYIMIPICTTGPLISQDAKNSAEDARKKAPEVDAGEASDNGGHNNQVSRISTAGPSFVHAASQIPLNAAGPSASTNAFEEHSFERFSPFNNAFSLPHVPMVIPIDDTRIFGNAYDDDVLEEEQVLKWRLIKDKEAEDVDVHLYISMIGSLMYLTASRPDIAFDVCACARFQVTPKTSHLHAVKRIFRYLKGQPKLGLWCPKDSPFDLEAYSDSDYAGASLDRKSTTGEYVAAANCCGQMLWIQNQLLDYGFNLMNTKIYIDNESTIFIVKNPIFHSKAKHIEIRHHFIRDAYEKKLIQVIKILTEKNIIDLLTKAFDVSKFQFLNASIGLLNLRSDNEYRLVIAKDERCFVDTSEVTTGNTLLSTTGLTTVGKRQSDMVRKRNKRIKKPAESARFEQIIDFLKSKPIHYALTVNPTIYVSCVKQFWATTKVKRVNDQVQIQALVDKKNVLIMKDNIRSDLCFDDAEGTTCLPSEAIFEGLARMGTMASAIICLADIQKFNFSKYIFDNMVKSLEGGIKFYLFLRFLQVFLDNQVEGMARHKEMKKQKEEAEVSHDESEDEDHVPTPSSDPLPSGRKNDNEMFGVDDLSGDEVVTIVADKVSAASTIDVTEDEITMAQALATLKSVKPKIVVQEQEVSTTIPAAATKVTTAVPTPRAKDPEVPIKKKDQIRMDEEHARQLEAEEQEAARLNKAQQNEEANILWDNTQAIMEADSLLAERLQAREREEFSEVQKARLLVELIEKRKKHFAALRAQEKRNKPPTKA
uniref:Integrase catalytic domain-containing protein n=1 Tax=Tanacetum cinerariifolium TaxID=118510 RepID=A0A6L2MWD1_TANCI|nr:hypothetical protein [Tanacetum cinerariifolium]